MERVTAQKQGGRLAAGAHCTWCAPDALVAEEDEMANQRWPRVVMLGIGLAAASCTPPYGRMRTLAEAGSTHRLVDSARASREERYQLGGRRTEQWPGVDCEGLVFLAYEAAYGLPWRRQAVNATDFVARGTLGAPVPALECVATSDAPLEQLRAGDIVLILRFKENPKERPLCRLGGRAAWVWHMGLYVGGPERLFVHADPFHREVVEVPLPRYLDNFWLNNAGVFVLRPPARSSAKEHPP